MNELRLMDMGRADGTNFIFCQLSKGWLKRSGGELWDNIHSNVCRQTWQN